MYPESEGPVDDELIIHDDLIEANIIVSIGTPYFEAETKNDSLCVPVAYQSRSKKH